MLLRRFRIFASQSVRSAVAVWMLIWIWGCSDERGDARLPTGPGALPMAFAPASELVAVEFDGAVTVVNDPTGYLAGNVSVGDSLIGLFVYDETAPDEHSKSDIGRYLFSDPSCMVSVSTGLLLFASDPAAVDITIRLLNDKKTNVLKDQFEVGSAANHDVLPGVGVASIDILLVDETATALSSDALAGQRPNAAEWLPTRTLVVAGVDAWTVEADINFITLSDPANIPRRTRKNIHQQ